MHPINKYFFFATLSVLYTSSFAAGNDTHAGQALTLSGKASAATSGSAAHSIAASGQVTIGASAIPLSIGGMALGSTGAISAGAAKNSMKAATAPIGTPLEISDEAITAMPPNEALKVNNDKKPEKGI